MLLYTNSRKFARKFNFDEIKLLNPKKIITFHINDLEDIPKEAITDASRLLMGKGIVPLDKICKALKDINYDGLCSIELFRPQYWQMNPPTPAKQARKCSSKILEKYSITDKNQRKIKNNKILSLISHCK